jgi:PEP-CTERM motif
MRTHQLSSLAVAAVAVLVAAAPARAAIYTFTGDTTSGSTFNRLLEDLSDLSAVGTAVRYKVFAFSVSAPGDYTFITTTASYDPFTFLYSPTFAPATPLSNALAANDDLLGLTTSGFTFALSANTPYAFINTGFFNSDFGAFSTTIGGPGNIIPAVIPEPSGYALLALGLVAVGLARRRSSRANQT